MNGNSERVQPKLSMKKVNFLISINNKTNPKKVADILERIVEELQERGIAKKIKSSFTIDNVTADFNGKAED